MNLSNRHDRVRRLVSGVNRQRRDQAMKIDILCNDIIEAQRGFIGRFDTVSFAASFYESIVGSTDLSRLLYRASNLIKGEIPDANIAFVLRQEDGFELSILESDTPIALDREQLENCLTNEMVNDICESNRVCTLEDMFSMGGLQGNPALMNKVSAVTVPLGDAGVSPGFILIYRSSEKELTVGDLNNVTAIKTGLSRAILSCQTLGNSAI